MTCMHGTTPLPSLSCDHSHARAFGWRYVNWWCIYRSSCFFVQLYSCMKMSSAALYCSPISLACRQLCNKTCQQFMSHVIAFIELLRRKRISSITVVMSCLSFPSQLSFCYHFLLCKGVTRYAMEQIPLLQISYRFYIPCSVLTADWQLWQTHFCLGGIMPWL